ncbi:CobW family GTP-binding protein [Benzoatithermus flavus]|uniref:GTP-binding protein n=1 Tax=Benzoatithermus flavus TaxID=3108223 RepID=A0ABU8XSE1_9PROT
MIREHRPVTVNLLTGFLGSGKTSLLKRLLCQPSLEDTAVLINEFGEVGLDHLLIEEVDQDVVLLKSGCVCCTVRGDLRDGLDRLFGRMLRGEVPRFSRVVIETTGLADPVPIVASFSADPALRYHFQLGNVVTVIDAVNGMANLARHPEALKQVALADRLVVSKTDLVGPEEVAALCRRLAALNPTAAIHRSSEDEPAPASLLLDDVHDPARKGEEVRRWLAAAEREALHDDHRHHHDDSIATFCLSTDEPLDWAPFGLWLSMLLNRHGSEILRLKGLLWVEGVDRPVVVQGVQHLVHKPVHLDAWPDGKPVTRLVVIGRGLDRAAILRSFRAFNRLGRSAAGAAYSAATAD